jgi:O-antigen/teichoic acid export membrane protein
MDARFDTGSSRNPDRARAAILRRPWTAGKVVWTRHHDLLNNAASLLATTGVTSGLGFAYWTVAAHLFSKQAVGYGSAAISAMTLLGTIGMFGLGTVLIGELPRRRRRAGLVSASLLTAASGSLILALGFVLIASRFSSHLADISGSIDRAALFAVGVVLTATTLVFDSATIGLLRGGLQLTRNIAFAVAKMLALIVVAVVLHDAAGVNIILSWVVATAFSVVPVAIRLWITREPLLPRPDWKILRSIGGKTTLAHNWLNLAIQAPVSLMPVLVALVVSATANAGFYIAWTISSFLFLLPVHLSTVLFAVAASDPQAIPRKLRFSLRVSLLLGIPGMAALGLGAHLILSIFGADYARSSTTTMWILIAAYIPSIPKCFYVAVCRAVGNISKAAAVLSTFGAIEVTAAVVGGMRAGVLGVVLALLAVAIVEGIVTTPAVIRTAVGYGRHRRPARAELATGLSAEPLRSARPARTFVTEPMSTRPERGLTGLSHKERQEAAIAVLLSIASSTTVSSVPRLPSYGLPDPEPPRPRRSKSPASLDRS